MAEPYISTRNWSVDMYGNEYEYPKDYSYLNISGLNSKVSKNSAGNAWNFYMEISLRTTGAIHLNDMTGANILITLSEEETGTVLYTQEWDLSNLTWNESSQSSDGYEGYRCSVNIDNIQGISNKINVFIRLDTSKIPNGNNTGYYSTSLGTYLWYFGQTGYFDVSDIQINTDDDIITEFWWDDYFISTDWFKLDFIATKEISKCLCIIYNIDTNNTRMVSITPTHITDESTEYHYSITPTKNKVGPCITYGSRYRIIMYLVDCLGNRIMPKNNVCYANTANRAPIINYTYIPEPNLGRFTIKWESDIPVDIIDGYPTTTHGTIQYKIENPKNGIYRVRDVDLTVDTKFTIKANASRHIESSNTKYGSYTCLKQITTKIQPAEISEIFNFILGNNIVYKLFNYTGAPCIIQIYAGGKLILSRAKDGNVFDGYDMIVMNDDEIRRLYKVFKNNSNKIHIISKVITVYPKKIEETNNIAECTINGNIPTSWIGGEYKHPIRCKVFIGNSDEIPKRCISWIGCEGDIPKRCI